ncbi:DUF2723 domain-containing protein [Taibaiella lutea]|uniref:DUF2723 domain-containing protein n=1 Tax=Taibaiella lutea TaxID=2608001 RepID=A0A5M6CQB4_9BACT|nr:DUF2723 domain-containing protein [Taibaiella lutea]KAA5537471.1 DUF2723 domain-containing protein [Taibaiella lutea]
MNFKKINNLCGWAVFAIAYLVYLLTMERTVSFWDCGEFLSTAYGLEVGHSPGAPLFMLLGRLFGLFASPLHVAMAINSLSALTSGLTILFLFWTITHFAKKLLLKDGEELTQSKLIAIMGAGIVGALAYTFSDTFWFSAVEAEVYATSSFFTAIVFWAILKWEHSADEPHSDRWLVLISYLMGLSIGVHLLNLLTIPALAMVYYFRKKKPTLKGSVIAFIIGCVLLGAFQVGLIQGIPILASKFELLFVNSFGLPLDSGALFFIALLIAIIVGLLIWAKKNGKYHLHIGVLCFVFALVGYSSYVSIIIRSRADVGIDMTNPDDVLSLLSYLQREQYGSQPIVFGPDYNSEITGRTEAKPVYSERTDKDGKTTYKVIGTHSSDYTYNSSDERFFPRIYDQGHAGFYQKYLEIPEGDKPTASDNYKFFFKYQMNWMWWRYFMWNYAGRQNDFAGSSYEEPENGNWISGIKPVDKFMGRGDLDAMPDYMKNNHARNQLYFLPLILGIMGLVYQFKRNKRDGTVIGLLFFFTGIAIVIYLNNTPQQPRERDYAYAGATYAFAVWIGLGVLMVTDLLRKYLKQGSIAPVAATLLTLLAVPTLMACENWDDHDRSQKTLARSTAYDVLTSLDKNAILFTVGDNDTYPLWYMQEVEGYRTDVRIINLSLLGIDWYIDQLRYKINDADAVPMIWKPENYEAENRNVVIYKPFPGIPADKSVNLEEVLDFINSDDQRFKVSTQSGDSYSVLPTQNLFVKVDKNAVLKNGLVNIADSAKIADINFILKKDQLYKPDLGILNIIAAVAKEGWKRPVYFSAGFPGGSDFQGLEEYMQMEGLANKLVPIRTVGSSPAEATPQRVNNDKSFDLYMNKFIWGGTDKKNIYFDEKNKAMLMSYRYSGAKVAESLIREGRKEDAIKLLDKITTNITYESYQYDQTMWPVVSAYYSAGAKDKATKFAGIIVRDSEKMINYLSGITDEKQRQWGIDVDGREALGSIQYMAQFAQQNGDTAHAEEWMKMLMSGAQKLGIPLH